MTGIPRADRYKHRKAHQDRMQEHAKDTADKVLRESGYKRVEGEHGLTKYVPKKDVDSVKKQQELNEVLNTKFKNDKSRVIGQNKKTKKKGHLYWDFSKGKKIKGGF